MKRLLVRYCAGAAVIAFTGACESPSGPSPTASAMQQHGTHPGASAPGTNVTPSVRLTTPSGAPISGAVVTFEVAAGGGSINTSSATTNSNGVATVTWMLGPGMVENRLIARHASLEPVTFRVWGCSTFCIDLRFVGDISPAHYAAFQAARQRWEDVITGDLQPVQMNVAADVCKDAEGEVLVNTPALNEVIDDLVVFVSTDSIDGNLGVLGAAGPCFIRQTSRLPVFGIMRFDEADLDRMERDGLLEDVVLHELGHVFGFPTIWGDPAFDLIHDTATAAPYFSGTSAADAFEAAGGTLVAGVGVPLEDTGGEGTRNSHWKEAILGTELMTGTIQAGTNPLSAITIGSLQDLGYQVSFATADPYSVPDAGMMAGLRTGPSLEIIELPGPRPLIVR